MFWIMSVIFQEHKPKPMWEVNDSTIFSCVHNKSWKAPINFVTICLSVCLSVCLSAHNNLVPVWWIFVQSKIAIFDVKAFIITRLQHLLLCYETGLMAPSVLITDFTNNVKIANVRDLASCLIQWHRRLLSATLPADWEYILYISKLLTFSFWNFNYFSQKCYR
jgi:hypothetical protein